MIVSNLQHTERIESLHPLFKKAFDYIKSHDLLNTPCGRIEIEGEETIGWKPLEDCTDVKQAYDTSADCAFYADRAQVYVTLHPGQFMIVWPEDSHAPVIGSGKVRKLIVKVKV